jgi:hypothetical protein
MGSRKGQAVVFESVLIFTISVAIFVVCYAVFTIYQYSYFTPIGTSDQLGEVRDYLSSHIVAMSQREGDGWVLIQLPRYAGNEEYRIDLSENGLNISTSEAFKFSNLYNLGSSFELTGRAASPQGKITLKKEGNKIIME